MKKDLILLVTLALLPLVGFSQGMLFDSESFKNVPKAPTSDGSKSIKPLPLMYDLSKYTPTILKQGEKDMTCVAISTAYYAVGIQRAVQQGISSSGNIANTFSLSPLFSFSRLQKDCSMGIDLNAVANDLKLNGGISFSALNSSECKDKRIATIGNDRHNYFKIKEFQWVFDKKNFPEESSIYDIKKHVSENRPVVVGLPLHSNFSKIRQDYPFYEPSQGTPSTVTHNGKIYALCHAVTVVGYDSNRELIKLVNCYGSAWGQNGFFWMTEADFERYALGGFVLQLFPEQSRSTQDQIPTYNGTKLGGDFEFKSITTSPNGLIFKTESPRYVRNGLYELAKKDWKKGQMFQLFAKNSTQGESMCVFSINEQQQINVHWPSSYAVSKQGSKTLNTTDIFGGFEVSDMIGNSSQVVIPGTESALTIEEKGKDYLCILFGKNSIQSELTAILSKLQQTDATLDFSLRLRQALGSRAVTSGVTYSPDQMHFEATPQQGDIVPIILEVISK
ncbi:C1 family peptidase [Runella salmonicolor]|uniref:Peptidase C1A papain C-terminal domain-containing protein n=1 Tax=Runella salmonicolor TaxID=2950278 RepID=A0ABT1FWV2_9BACT|nr:C1 family peptidase [Runella salmonicolor]MCP1386250.1 hypothetical protein [Runella salmonicolor]